MTDLPALLAAVLARPADDTPRLVLADWLDDHAGTVPCATCQGSGVAPPTAAGLPPIRSRIGPDGRVERYMDVPPLLARVPKCPACDGSGSVSDGRRERAEFIRVQVELARLVATIGAAPHEHGVPSAEKAQWLRRRERGLWACFGGPYHAARVFGGLPDNWWAGLAPLAGNAYAPSDGELVIRRGFPDEARLTLAQLVGEKCRHCTDGMFGYPPERDCPACGATGWANPGAAAGLGRLPLTRVVVVGAEPLQETTGVYSWRLLSHLQDAQPHHIPAQVFDLIGEPSGDGWYWKSFPTRDAALDALSAACLAYCQDRAAEAAKAEPVPAA